MERPVHVVIAFFIIFCSVFALGPNAKLEQSLLNNYNRRHRPVKKESTTLMVSVILSVSHVEKINEQEQTMLVHGHLWATWKDEYLNWQPSSFNGTTEVALDSWKIWQPALSLYNSARGNSWHLYMHGVPVVVTNEGVVFASGSFSFHVTCLFDFSDWPYDVQRCPIVIADWVYDLSRVNLSDATASLLSPQLRLNFDPFATSPKKYISGWEMIDSWRRHCYWGHQGCRDDPPISQPDWYWSLLEFGIVIRRHAPYFLYTVILPTVLSSGMTLASFWLETDPYPVLLLLFNICLQAFYGWDLIRQLPPGSGSVPKIVSLYALNLSLTTVAVVFHFLTHQLVNLLPEQITLTDSLREWARRLYSSRAFTAQGFSFDPRELEKDMDEPAPSTSPTSMVSPSHGSVLVAMEDEDNIAIVREESTANGESAERDGSPVERVERERQTYEKTTELFAVARRFLFFVFLFIYLIALPYCLLF